MPTLPNTQAIPRKARDVVRLTADLPRRDSDLLAATAKQMGYNKVTTLVRAIRVLSELARAEDEHADVLIVHRDGTKERLLIK